MTQTTDPFLSIFSYEKPLSLLPQEGAWCLLRAGFCVPIHISKHLLIARHEPTGILGTQDSVLVVGKLSSAMET